jgi:xylose isomerase
MKYSVITASLGNLGDRFLTTGYKAPISFEEKLERVKALEVIEGIELCFDPEGEESDSSTVRAQLDRYGLESPVVNAPLNSEIRWSYGTLSSAEAEVREQAVAVVKKTIDFAAGVGAELVNLWMGQDGFDYPFQEDYTGQWERLIESVRACADYSPEMRLALEFKPREPRNRALLNTAATTLLLIQEADRSNVGVTVDNGHVLQHGENMGQVVELCAHYGKLFNLHLNDNYAAWDDDMIVGSVHLVEYLELMYVLRKIGYDRWCAIDIFPFRENAFRSTEESVRIMMTYDRWIDTVGFGRISELIASRDATEVMKTIRTTLFM